MKEAPQVTRWMVLGLLCVGGAALIWRSAMPKGAFSRHHPRGQTLYAVNKDGQQTLSASKLQEVRSADLSNSGVSSSARVSESYNKLPLSFEANRGQADPRVKFLSRGRGYTLFLTSDEAVFTLKKAAATGGQPRAFGNPKLAMLGSKFTGGFRGRATDAEPWGAHRLVPRLLEAPKSPVADIGSQAAGAPDLAPAVLRMKLVGANAPSRVKGLQELPGKSNYFLGKDPGKWRTNVPSFAKVRYEDIYPGVSLVYYGNPAKPSELEYDFVVAPGIDPKAIKLAIQGASKVTVDARGDLVAQLDGQEMRLHKPLIYQREENESNSRRHSVDGSYVLAGGGQVAIKVSAYDPHEALVIDPVLEYSTYFGGSGDDVGSPSGVQGIAVDPEGNAYITGATDSVDFPVISGALQTKLAGGSGVFGCPGPISIAGDAFVTKLNPSGNAIVYSTYVGGSDDDCGEGIAVDPSGNAYVAGETLSTDFPITKGAFQPACASCSNGQVDTFAAKLNRDGSALVYSTYIGGDNADLFPMVALDRSGNLYIQGSTFSTDYPTTKGAFQTACLACPSGGANTYVTKLNPQGSALAYSTYLGGSVFEFCGSQIAVDSAGDAYVNGFTCSTDFPTHNSLQGYAGGCDGFLTKLNPAGNALVYSTYLGGNNFEIINGTAVDSAGNAYVSGSTFSSDFPTTPGAFQTNFVGGSNCSSPPCADAFAAKINPSGSALVYSTDLGGTGDDHGVGMAVDAHGDAYVGGPTSSTDFPILSAFQPTNAGGYDVFVTELNPAGNALVFSTYLGGSGDDFANGIILDRQRRDVYVEGFTTSTDFPTVNAAQPQFGGGTYDAIVAKIGPGNPPADAAGVRLSPPNNADSSSSIEKPKTRASIPNQKIVIPKRLLVYRAIARQASE